MFRYVTKCRACNFGDTGPGGIKSGEPDKLIPVFNLGLQPLANSFRTKNEEQTGYAPLEVLYCPRCSLAQLSVVVDPKILYSNYSYVTSPSQTMLNHFQNLYNDLSFKLKAPWRVMEIGSNDGTLLNFLKQQNNVESVNGVDPAANLAGLAAQKGINTHVALWGTEAAESVKHWNPNLIIARHVFCHIDNWREFVDALSIVSSDETLIAIEIPNVVNTLNKLEFDTIYHEHLSYASVKSIIALLKDTEFCVTGLFRYEIHGGAILVLIQKRNKERLELVEYPEIDIDDWREFSRKSCMAISSIRAFVLAQKTNGKRICGYGASAKSTVMLNACKLDRSHIDFICDGTPFKQWRLSPGTNIPIVDEGALLRELPDYALMHCWNFKKECLEKNELARSKGVKFVIPIPEIEVV